MCVSGTLVNKAVVQREGWTFHLCHRLLREKGHLNNFTTKYFKHVKKCIQNNKTNSLVPTTKLCQNLVIHLVANPLGIERKHQRCDWSPWVPLLFHSFTHFLSQRYLPSGGWGLHRHTRFSSHYLQTLISCVLKFCINVILCLFLQATLSPPPPILLSLSPHWLIILFLRCIHIKTWIITFHFIHFKLPNCIKVFIATICILILMVVYIYVYSFLLPE